MKNLMITVALLAGVSAQAATEKQNFINGYAKAVYARYAASTEAAKNLDLQIQAFVANPTDAGLQAVKQTWVEARKIYDVTEVYRFYEGPIDSEDGPEGAINGWPLDENYIDYVVGKPNSGIINNVTEFPEINAELLLSLNELDGEKNLSTGWHAIEFLLWGQDRSATGPGNRSYKDYVDAPNAARRKDYLSATSALLVAQLSDVTEQWNPANKSNYAATFVTDSSKFEAVLAAAEFLAGDELSKERMLVAYESQLQEDEHSCFSDTTSNDIYYNYVGIKNVLTEQYDGVSFVSLVAQKDAALAKEIQAKLTGLDGLYAQFPPLFDQAIVNENDRVIMKAIIDNLGGNSEAGIVGLSEQIRQGIELLK